MSDNENCKFTQTCNAFQLYGWWWLLVIFVLSLLFFVLMTYAMIKLFNLYCPYATLRSYKHQDRRKISKIQVVNTVKKLERRTVLPGDLPKPQPGDRRGRPRPAQRSSSRSRPANSPVPQRQVRGHVNKIDVLASEGAHVTSIV